MLEDGKAGPIGRDTMDGILAVTGELRARVRRAFEPFEGVYRIDDLGEYVSEDDWREVWGGRPAWHEKAWMLADNGRLSAAEVAAMSPEEIEAAYGDPAFEPEVAFYTEADEKGEL